MKDFRKYWRYIERRWGINQLEIKSVKFKIVFNVIAENQPVVF